jgi:hypothetical protein
VLTPLASNTFSAATPERSRKIRRAIVAYAGASLGQTVNVPLVEPDAVAERHLPPQQVKATDIFDRGPAAAPTGIFLLVGRHQQVHVQRHAVFARSVGELPQRFIGAPV